MSKVHIAMGALLFSVVCSAKAEDVNGLVAGLDARFDEAWNTRDAQQLASLYASDAILVPALAPAGSGREAVVAFFAPLFKDNWSGHRLEPITAQQTSDNTIVAAAHWSAHLTDAGGKTTRYHGDVAQVFKKVGDRWQVALTSWNVLPDK